MDKTTEEKLIKFQEFISYRFKDPYLLFQALTTPQYGNQNYIPHYEILESLGDAVLKLIFSLKLYDEGLDDPGDFTKTKQRIEDNQTLLKVAKEMELGKYIFISNKQKLEGTTILADVFEAICGAIYLDSNNDLKVVEQKMLNRYFSDWDSMIEQSPHLYKNQLLEYLQNIYKFTPKLLFEYERLGPLNDTRWIAKNPRIIDQTQDEILKIPSTIRSEKFKRKKDAEKDLSLKILKYLQEE
ncbi:MAG: ribonuclease III domain-containing protein [Candidatus Hermodarchaeota archaeon]